MSSSCMSLAFFWSSFIPVHQYIQIDVPTWNRMLMNVSDMQLVHIENYPCTYLKQFSLSSLQVLYYPNKFSVLKVEKVAFFDVLYGSVLLVHDTGIHYSTVLCNYITIVWYCLVVIQWHGLQWNGTGWQLFPLLYTFLCFSNLSSLHPLRSSYNFLLLIVGVYTRQQWGWAWI